MRERIQGLLPEDASGRCWVGTFHQLGMRLIDLMSDTIPEFRRNEVLEEDDALTLFRDSVKETKLDVSPSQVATLFARVSLLKQNLVPLHDSELDDETRQAYGAYQASLEHRKAFDLDDLLVQPVNLLRAHPNEADRIATGITRHLLIDEFQDVNRAQYELVRILARDDSEGLFAIGDPDQAIYGFRGADRDFFFQFAKELPARANRQPYAQLPFSGNTPECSGGRTERTRQCSASFSHSLRWSSYPSSGASQRDTRSQIYRACNRRSPRGLVLPLRRLGDANTCGPATGIQRHRSTIPTQRSWGCRGRAVCVVRNSLPEGSPV